LDHLLYCKQTLEEQRQRRLVERQEKTVVDRSPERVVPIELPSSSSTTSDKYHQHVINRSPLKYRTKIKLACDFLTSVEERFDNLLVLLIELFKAVPDFALEAHPVDWTQPGLVPLLDLLAQKSKLTSDLFGRKEIRDYVDRARGHSPTDEDELNRHQIERTKQERTVENAGRKPEKSRSSSPTLIISDDDEHVEPISKPKKKWQKLYEMY